MRKKNLLMQAARLILVMIFATAGFVPNHTSQAQESIKSAKPWSGGKLSARLYLLANSPALQAASAAEQAKKLSLPEKGAGSLVRNDQGQLLVNLRMTDVSETQLQLLRRAGAQIAHVSKEYQTVAVYVDVSRLSAIANLPVVQYVEDQEAPEIAGNPAGAKASRQQQGYSCPSGIVVSEGDSQLRAAQARPTYSVDGSGIKIGVLSDSYDQSYSSTNAAGDIATGDLPGPGNPCGHTTAIYPIYDDTSGTDEGRGMLQIIHDLAPAAALSFATANPTELAFADNIRTLRAAGADIIVDDVSYYDEPFFQDGPVGKAINDVVAGGALYFTSAANSNTIVGGHDVSSYEAPAFRAAPCPAGLGVDRGDCHDFDPGPGINTRSRVTLSPGGWFRLTLQWAEPWYGIADDLDIYLVDDAGKYIAGTGSWYDNFDSGEPFEYFQYQNASSTTKNVYLVIHRYSGTGTPRLKYMFWRLIGVTSVQYNVSSGGDIVGPSIPGHSANKSAFSVAAAPYYNNNTPEYYSSRGPAAHYFGPVTGSTPAARLTNQEILQQPDFTATDGGCTTFFGDIENGCNRFYGTSAAAPHAAAVAALLKQRSNSAGITLTRARAKVLLQVTARSMSGGNVNSVGAGLLDAYAVMNYATVDIDNFYYLPINIRR